MPSNFDFFGKSLIALGILAIIIGIILLYSHKIPYFGNLPGDISIKKKNFTFYFPITTCILLSLLLTFLLYIIGKLK